MGTADLDVFSFSATYLNGTCNTSTTHHVSANDLGPNSHQKEANMSDLGLGNRVELELKKSRVTATNLHNRSPELER